MSDKNKFEINMGPGTVVGAMSVGPGARAEGSVSVGGPKPPVAPNTIRCRVDIRRMSPNKAARFLRTLAERVEHADTDTYASGSVDESGAGEGIAWTTGHE